ncbi:hypothetical protein D3C75_250950 [compost metagenome]
MSRFALGHILIKSRNLKQTVDDYERMGFTVTYRANPGKAHNALIFLQDGAFLELFDPKPFPLPDKLLLGLLSLIRPLQPHFIERYRSYIRGGEGLADFALDSMPAHKAADYLQERIQAGVKLGKRLDMSKKLQDGRKQTWWIAPPEDTGLPFLMSEYDPAVPCTEAETTHANGVLGIDTLVIDVPDLTEWTAKIELLLGDSAIAEDSSESMFELEKGHRILLRQSDRYRLAEIHLQTSASTIMII